MPKQTDISIENRKAFLVMPEVKFKQALEERILLGKELLKIQVTRNTIPYGMAGYGRFSSMSLMEVR